jgi:CDP-L-myo-inositol myo-inositolphosphotransferase
MASLDGTVSRYLNRRLSVPAARLLARTPVTPNEMSCAALIMAAASLLLLAIGHNIEGGVVIQLSSIVDGIDGDLARAKSMASRFGGLLDSVLDRYADALIVGGMAWYAYEREYWTQPLLVGFVAIAGCLLVTYSRARLETEAGTEGMGDLLGIATRDVRLLALAVGCVAGQPYWAMIVVASACYLTVCWRLWRFWRGTSDGGVFGRNAA